MRSVLGIHRDPWHDTGAAIVWGDGSKRMLCAVSEERYDRKKDSRSFPARSMLACLQSAGLSIENIDLTASDYIRSPSWDDDYFKIRSSDSRQFVNIDTEKHHILNHHLCHAAACVYTSGFRSSAILVIDGRGSNNETQSLFYYDGREINLLEKSDCIGIGLLYAAVTQAIGFKLLQEGKTMGLAPYGRSYYEEGKRVFEFGGRCKGIMSDYSRVCKEGTYKINSCVGSITTEEDKALGAYQVQLECENEMLRLARYAKERTGSENLCITGGVGLNSVANMKILNSGLFQNVYINPACSDTGIPLGAALYSFHNILGVPYVDESSETAYVGPSHPAEEVNSSINALDERKYDIYNYTNPDEYLPIVTEDLRRGLIVGICHGPSEVGPRALGNRSILMNATQASNKDTLNKRVKHREAFRPFAPVCLVEHYQDYFEINSPSRYMLFVPQVKSEKVSVIPACTHVDGSARLQTLSATENTVTRLILESYYKLTNIPVLLNTSFNDNNEPIVESPRDAVSCFERCALDALLLEGVYVRRK